MQNKWINVFEENPNYLILGRLCNSQGWTYSELYDIQKVYSFNKRTLDDGRTFKKILGTFYSSNEMQAHEVNVIENELEMGKIDDVWKHIIQFEKVTAQPEYDYARMITLAIGGRLV